ARSRLAAPFGGREDLARVLHVRLVDHPAIEPRHARAAPGFDRLDHAPGPVDLVGTRLEGSVHDIDMLRVNDRLRGEAVTAGSERLVAQTVQVFDVDMDRVDRIDTGRCRTGQAQVARKPETVQIR